MLAAGGGAVPAFVRGEEHQRQLLIAQPLFEEMNRCRRFLAELCRTLDRRGIGSTLADLPGAGDNATAVISLQHMRTVFSALYAGRSARVFAMRGGALVPDPDAALPRYLYAPATGDSLLRDLLRTQSIADQERTGARRGSGDYLAAWQQGREVSLAGYTVPPELAAALGSSTPTAVAQCRIAGPPPADFVIDSPPVWRQADPVDTPETIEALAADIDAWFA
jgi:hypothetical protein